MIWSRSEVRPAALFDACTTLLWRSFSACSYPLRFHLLHAQENLLEVLLLLSTFTLAAGVLSRFSFLDFLDMDRREIS